MKDPIRQNGRLHYKFFKPQKILKRTKTTVTLDDGRTWSSSQVAPASNKRIEDLSYFVDLELSSSDNTRSESHSTDVPMRWYPLNNTTETNKFRTGQ